MMLTMKRRNASGVMVLKRSAFTLGLSVCVAEDNASRLLSMRAEGLGEDDGPVIYCQLGRVGMTVG